MTMQVAELIRVSKGSVAISGEPLAYPNSPVPEMTASIMPIPPGGKTEWMTHPVPAYVYILEGELTVEFAGTRHAKNLRQAKDLFRREAHGTGDAMTGKPKCDF